MKELVDLLDGLLFGLQQPQQRHRSMARRFVLRLHTLGENGVFIGGFSRFHQLEDVVVLCWHTKLDPVCRVDKELSFQQEPVFKCRFRSVGCVQVVVLLFYVLEEWTPHLIVLCIVVLIS